MRALIRPTLPRQMACAGLVRPVSLEITSAASSVAPFKVVVAFDDTPPSWSALRVASTITRAFGGALTILHAVHPRESSFDSAATMKRALDTARKDATDLLARALQTLDYDVSSTSEVLSRDPVDAIVRHSAELGADLLVVGSHQRGALDRLLAGSVSEAIVRRATSPVLVVPVSRRGRGDRRDRTTSVRSKLSEAV